MKIMVNKEGYLLDDKGLPASLIVLTDDIKDAFGRSDRVEIVLINGTFKPVIKEQFMYTFIPPGLCPFCKDILCPNSFR